MLRSLILILSSFTFMTGCHEMGTIVGNGVHDDDETTEDSDWAQGSEAPTQNEHTQPLEPSDDVKSSISTERLLEIMHIIFNSCSSPFAQNGWIDSVWNVSHNAMSTSLYISNSNGNHVSVFNNGALVFEFDISQSLDWTLENHTPSNSLAECQNSEPTQLEQNIMSAGQVSTDSLEGNLFWNNDEIWLEELDSVNEAFKVTRDTE